MLGTMNTSIQGASNQRTSLAGLQRPEQDGVAQSFFNLFGLVESYNNSKVNLFWAKILSPRSLGGSTNGQNQDGVRAIAFGDVAAFHSNPHVLV